MQELVATDRHEALHEAIGSLDDKALNV